jgi:Xaa-Pro aminopeptidase
MHSKQLFDSARGDRRALFDSARLQASLARRGLDAVVAVWPVNITYSGGAYLSFADVLTFVVTTADGRQGVVINEADAYFFRAYSWIHDIRTFRFISSLFHINDSAVDTLADLLAEFGLGASTLAIELGYLPQRYYVRLVERLPRAVWREAGPVFEEVRQIKTPAEVELIRAAVRATDEAVLAGLARSRQGQTEKEIAAHVQGAVLELGADALAHCHIQAGAHSTIAHSWPTETPVRSGDVIHIDFGAVFGGYVTDIARNATVGEPTARQERLWRSMYDIEQQVLERVRAGTSGGELWEVAQRAFGAAGLLYPWGTLGHSTGLAVHEGFEISGGSEAVLEPNMVVNIEPSHIEPGDARYHLEDTILVTATGYERLSNAAETRDMIRLGSRDGHGRER